MTPHINKKPGNIKTVNRKYYDTSLILYENATIPIDNMMSQTWFLLFLPLAPPAEAQVSLKQTAQQSWLTKNTQTRGNQCQ